MSSHTFAVYYAGVSALKDRVGICTVVDDKLLHHRVAHVLRFAAGDSCILFNAQYHATVRVETITKKHLELFVESVELTTPLTPQVTLLLPVLKKQALAEAVYSAVEMGVTDIQLIVTQKVQRTWAYHELERLQSVVIAACEQAKYFVVPEVRAPINLQQALAAVSHINARIYYDPDGISVNDFTWDGMQPIVVMVGPEGDLTQEEKALLHENNFKFVRLTPTILRSVQAVALGVGLVRTLLNSASSMSAL